MINSDRNKGTLSPSRNASRNLSPKGQHSRNSRSSPSRRLTPSRSNGNIKNPNNLLNEFMLSKNHTRKKVNRPTFKMDIENARYESEDYEGGDENGEVNVSDSEALEEEILTKLGEALRLEEIKREEEKKELSQDLGLDDQYHEDHGEDKLREFIGIEEGKLSRIEKDQNISESIEFEQHAHRLNDSDDVRDLISQLKLIRKPEDDSFQQSLNFDESTVLREKPSPVKNDSVQNQINEIEKMMKERDRKEDVWRKKVDSRIEKLQECMIRQSEALESLSQVLNKEIENRLAGENKVQKYMTLLAEKVATATKSHLTSMNEMQDLVSSTRRSSKRPL